MRFTWTLIVWGLVACPVFADGWTLDNAQSELHFISTKKGDVAEVHRFKNLKGSVKADGELQLEIELASVDTAVPIRDERMRDMLFEVGKFPTATVEAQLDPRVLGEVKVGGTKKISTEGTLHLHGQSKAIIVEAMVVRTQDNEIRVFSAKPVIVDASNYELAAGVEALREVVQLPSISETVPVTFALTFTR
jgi:polyisoprenoid-binding protein YceI